MYCVDDAIFLTDDVRLVFCAPVHGSIDTLHHRRSNISSYCSSNELDSYMTINMLCSYMHALY